MKNNRSARPPARPMFPKIPKQSPEPLPDVDKIRTARSGGTMKSKMAHKGRKFRSKSK
jgi:hypothetical protein